MRRPVIKRFNYTGRKTILPVDVQIVVANNAAAEPSVDAKINLERYGLPPDSLIYLEAYRQSTLMRFDWGTIARQKAPANCILADFGSLAGVRFRVKVVEFSAARTAQPARLLAIADQIAAIMPHQPPGAPASLLDLVPADIHEVWRLEFEDGSEPYLAVNQELVSNLPSFGRSDQFVSMILPQVLRSILERILVVERFESSADSSDWQQLWLDMAHLSLGAGSAPRPISSSGGELENLLEVDEWIDEVADRFVDQCHLRTRFSQWWDDGDNP